MRLFENAKYPFLQWRTRAYVVTALLFAATLGAMALNKAQIGSWLNYGVDFTGGTLTQVAFQQPTDVETIRAAAARAGHQDWEITQFGNAREYVIRMPAEKFGQDAQGDAQTRVREALSGSYPAAGAFNIERTEAVGAKVGDELETRALVAILLSLLATLAYLAVRFEWRFGVAAVAATGHDILITLGILAVMRSEISLGTVAAFLTIVGYSLNDTIVVFDRIRENLGKPRHGRSYLEILNLSINETLPRTVLTGSTSLLTLLSLYIFGGPVIRDFALVLMLGIMIGTFSSIFVASPVLYLVEQKWPNKPQAPKPAAPSRSRSRSGSSATMV